MPGKHVHFEDVSSPLPATPMVPFITVLSPSSPFSTSSMTMSPEPTSPPPLGFGSPNTNVPLPGNGTPHPLFCKNSGYMQLYAFDISKHPSEMSNNIPRHMWDQPASVPSTSSMTFVCERLPWTFTVVPSNGNRFVTVRDLFEGLYTALRKPVQPQEFNSLSITERDEVTSAYIARCKHFFDQLHIYDQELSKGVKRVDLLGKYTMFAGTDYNALLKGGRWVLSTSKNVS